MTNRILLSEEAHIVNALPPIDITGGVASDVWSMKNHRHASILVHIGVSAAAFTKIILQACDDFVPTATEDIAFSVYSEETAAGDTLGARAAVAATGLTPTANNNAFYVLEVDASALPDGKPNLRVSLTNGANSVIASVVVILTGGRYVGDLSATTIA